MKLVPWDLGDKNQFSNLALYHECSETSDTNFIWTDLVKLVPWDLGDKQFSNLAPCHECSETGDQKFSELTLCNVPWEVGDKK